MRLVVAQGGPHVVFHMRCSFPCTDAGSFRKAGQYGPHSCRENPDHEKLTIPCRGSSVARFAAIIRRRDRDDWWVHRVIVCLNDTLTPVQD